MQETEEISKNFFNMIIENQNTKKIAEIKNLLNLFNYL